VSDLISDLRRLGEEAEREAPSPGLRSSTVRRVRLRQATFVSTWVALVALSVGGAVIGLGELRHGNVVDRSGAVGAPAPSPSVVVETIYLNSEHTRFFSPPGVIQPALSADEALAVFKASPDVNLPPDLVGQLGLYTAAAGDGSYLFQDQLAWGYSWHRCADVPHGLASPASDSQLPFPSCTLWLFLDANTGEMLEATWQAGA